MIAGSAGARAARRDTRRRERSPNGGAPSSAGFTYIGLLLLVAMMGLALTQAAAMWHTTQQRDREEELLFVGSQFRTAIARFYAAGGTYPQQLEDLVKDPRYPGVRRFLRKIYRDPITGGTEWGLFKLGEGRIAGVYSLSQEEPMKKAEFRLADQTFQDKTKYSEWVFMPRIGTSARADPNSPATPNSAKSPGRTQPQSGPGAQQQPGMTQPKFGTPQRQFGAPLR